MKLRMLFNRRTMTAAYLCFPLIVTACKSAPLQNSTLREESGTEKSVTIEPSFFPIAGPTDIIYQNRTITRNYYFGAEALNQALFATNENQTFESNWLHYGIWGSLRAGESIDGSDLQYAYAAKDFAFDAAEQALGWLPSSMRTQYVKSLRNDKTTVNTLIKIVQESLGAGNRRVADEIMGSTDKYIRAIGCDTILDEKRLNSFLGTFEFQRDRSASFDQIWNVLLTELPNLSAGKRHQHGQDALAKAYEAYHRAKFEVDPMIRSQMMYYGNVLIAIHEQFVLQTYISGALGILDPTGPLFRKVATLLSMDIAVPNPGFAGVSRDGGGLTRIPLRRGFSAKAYDNTLKTFTWAPLIDLARVTELDKYSGRGATDWTDYKSRVYFIAGMQRTYHHFAPLNSFPYVGPHQTVKLTCAR